MLKVKAPLVSTSVNYKFIKSFTRTFDKTQTRVPKVWAKKKDMNTDKKFLHHSSSTLFEFSSSPFKIRH